MARQERLTYFGYNEGFDPVRLRIGTLVLDYANPWTKKPFLHDEIKELLAHPPLATADERPICSLARSRNGSVGLGLGLEPLLEFEHSYSSVASAVVLGRNGSKVQLLDPHDFFETRILKNSKARIWLQTRLSVANKLKAVYGNVFGAPKIWLLTGIYLMDDAVSFVNISHSKSIAASASVPIVEPTGIAALLGASVGARFNMGSGFQGQAFATVKGTKVWAAQWTRVHARFAVGGDQAALGRHDLRLLDVWSTGTTRGSRGKDGETRVEVSLGDSKEDDASEAEGNDEYPEEIWARFMEEVDELLDDLED